MNQDKSNLITYFLRPMDDEIRSPAALSENLDAALNHNLTHKELSLILYHSTRDTKNNVYGEGKNKEEALTSIANKLQKWTDKVTHIKGKECPFTYVHMIESFRHLNLKPPERLVEFLIKTLENNIHQARETDIHFILLSFAELGITPSKKLYSGLNKRTLELQNEFDKNSLFDVVRSLCILDALHDVHYKTEENKNAKSSMDKVFKTILNNNKTREKLAVTEENKSQINILSDALLWFMGETPQPRIEDDVKSLYETDVAKAFSRAGTKVDEGVKIKNPNHTIDLKVTFNNTNIFIECDGPSHFIKSIDDHKMYPNGSTIFQTMLVAKSNPDALLLRLPSTVFYQNIDNPDFIDELLIQIDDLKDTRNAFVVGDNGLNEIHTGQDYRLNYNNT